MVDVREHGEKVCSPAWIWVLASIAVCASALYGQESPDRRREDTTRVATIRILDPGVSLGRPTFILPPSIRNEFVFHLTPVEGAGMLPDGRFYLVNNGLAGKADLLSPYLLQNRRANELHDLYMVLGAIELGGVAYLAYRQIKEYGFWP